MYHPIFRRAASLLLALTLALSLGLAAAAAEADGLCQHHTEHNDDCGYEAPRGCGHICSTETGCIVVPCRHVHGDACFDTQGGSICTHVCSKDTLCQIPDLNCLHTEHTGCGYTQGADCRFATDGCLLCAAQETQPEETQPEETQPEETQPETRPDYKITKGSGSKWRKDSGKDLSFTVNADTDDITAIQVNGKTLEASGYRLGKEGQVTLKSQWLQKQNLGAHKLTIVFDDGAAQGSFTVSPAADPTNPATGDTILLWVGVMVVSLTGLVILSRKWLA